MKIRMLKTVPGSLDGIHVTTYEDGKEYDLTGTPGARDLAQAFVGARMAVEVAPATASIEIVGQIESRPDGADSGVQIDGQGLDPAAEEKAVEAAPENKAMAAPATKRPYNRKG